MWIGARGALPLFALGLAQQTSQKSGSCHHTVRLAGSQLASKYEGFALPFLDSPSAYTDAQSFASPLLIERDAIL